MKSLIAGGSYYGLFVTSDTTGAAADATGTPTVIATKNGVDDGTFILTAAKIDTGRYKITGTVPATYVSGDSVQVSVAATVDGIATKWVADEFVVVVATGEPGGPPKLDDAGRLPVALQQIVGTAIDEDQSGNLADSFSELLDVPTTRPRQIVLASCNETDETALWTASGTGSIAWDADHSFRSVGSLTITAAADHTAQDAIFTPAATIYANGGIGIAMRSDDASQIESLKIYLYYDADEYYWLNVPFYHATPKWKAAPAIGADWRIYWSEKAPSWGHNRAADLPVWGSATTPALPITKIVVRVTALTGQTVTINVGQILTNAVVTPVPICLHFDDAFAGVYDITFPILTAAGLTGSVWVNVGTVGTAGYMTWAQIKELAAAGWEIGSHASRNHESFPATVGEAEATNLMTDNWRTLVKEVPEAYQEGMVIPSGDAMLATGRFGNVAASVGHKVLFGRATRDGHPGVIGAYWNSICGLDAAVPSILQRIEAAGWSVDDFDEVNAAKGESGQGGQSLHQYFDTQVRFGNPIVLFFHDIAATSYDVYTITTAMLQQIVDWIDAGRTAGTVVPVSTAGLVQRMRGGDFPRTMVDAIDDGGRLDLAIDQIAGDVAGLDGAAMLTQANVRTAVGLAAATLDTQLGDIPTVAEFNARTLLAAAYFDPAVDIVANVTLVDTCTTLTNKTGFVLASNGLDAIATTAPSSVATTFPDMMVQLWRRFFKKAVKDTSANTIKTYADNGTTVVTTQTIAETSTAETQGEAS